MPNDVNKDPNAGILDLVKTKPRAQIKRAVVRPGISEFNPLIPTGILGVFKLGFDNDLKSAAIRSQAFNLLTPNDRHFDKHKNAAKLQLNKFIKIGQHKVTQELAKADKIFADNNLGYITNTGQIFLLSDICSKIAFSEFPDKDREKLLAIYDELCALVDKFVIIAHGAETECKIITDTQALQALTDLINMSKAPVVLDIETNGLDPYTSKILGIGLALDAYTGYYIPLALPKQSHAINFGASQNEPVKICSESEVYDFVRNCLAKKMLIAHNAKFEYQFFKTHYSVELMLRHDTMVAEYILDCRLKGRFNLGACVKERFPMVEEWKESKDFFKNLSSIAISKVAKYCAKDCCNEYLLFMAQFSKLIRDFQYLAYDVDMPFIKIIADAELQGFSIDQGYLVALNAQLKTKVGEIDNLLKTHIGEANPDSPAQLREILFRQLKFEPIKTTASGVESVDSDTLEALQKKHNHEVLNLILERRGVKKLEATYTLSFIEKLNKITGNIHPSFMNTDTETGRLSCRNPNFQVGNSKIWRIAGIS